MAVAITILLDIAVLLVVAKIFGEIAERLRLSQLVGEIVAGILIGALHIISRSEFMDQLVLLGIVFLFFIIGMETKFHANGESILMALVSAILSFAAGFFVGYFVFSVADAFVLGLALMSTSTLVSLHSYINIGQIRTHAHELVLAINSFDEILAILVITILLSAIAFAFSVPAIAVTTIIVGAIIFLLAKLSNHTSRMMHIFENSKDAHLLTAATLIMLFIVSFVAEQIGIAFVGAFLAGMAISKASNTESRILPSIKTIGFGFFIPLFFAYTALSFSILSAAQNIHVILLLLLLASLTKIIGVVIPAKFLSKQPYDSLLAGIGMIPRGEYAVVIVHAALAASLITSQIYTVVVAFALLSMIITPLLLKFYLRRM